MARRGSQGVLDSADVRATIGAVRALGAEVTPLDSTGPELELEVRGWGDAGPQTPAAALDCGNSGTTARMLLGVLAGWPIAATLVGDESLSKRPMTRVTAPLEQMGATFTTEDGRLPVTVRGGDLRAIKYTSPVASAQVKTAILIAGLQAVGRTLVREPNSSRDHTERLLPAFGVPVGRDAATHTAWVEGPVSLRAHDLAVPGDPSSAAFPAVAALIVRGSRIVLPDVALNPTRIGFLHVLARMGASIQTAEGSGGMYGAEPVGTVSIVGTETLKSTTVLPHEVPTLVDEVPILALAATQAYGPTRFEGVGELRVKESDRLTAVSDGLTALGARVCVGDDWLEVTGPTPLRGAVLDSLGDHRLAMTWAVAGLIASGPVQVDRFEAVDVSYPGFADDLARLLA